VYSSSDGGINGNRGRILNSRGLAAIIVTGVLAAVAALAPGAGSAAFRTAAQVRLAAATDPCQGRKSYSIFYATHARPNPFWTPLQKGATEGASLTCLRETWTQSPGATDFADQVNRAKAGIAEHPDILVISMANPQAMDSTVRDAISKGITVINVNANDTRPASQQPQYTSYVGIYDELYTGIAAAKAMLSYKKVTHVVVTNPSPGAVNVERRVKGFVDSMKAAGVTADVIDTQFNTAQVVQTYLVAHPNTDGFYSTGSGPTGSPTVRAVISQLGLTNKIALVGGDPTTIDLQAIQSGSQIAGITQQQYLQGWFPPIIGRTYLETGMAPLVVSTGPGVVDKSNVDKAVKLALLGLQ
jgi:simple sugar transport system substrate-binding protein